MADRQQFSSFFVNDLLFGVEVERVKEVTSGAEMTPVPLAPPEVKGLINLRGEIVTVIDLRRCLRLSEQTISEPLMTLIVFTDDGCVSLLVDHVGDVLEVDEDSFELPPETLQGWPRKLIRGAYKLDGGLLLALDVGKVLDGIAKTIPTQSGSDASLEDGHELALCGAPS
jgi:purine-binding chemotaxis protein CheW